MVPSDISDCRYVRTSGDTGVLDERQPFLNGSGANGAGLDPGYIRGYVPGVRENGGQYTHGAIWAAMAFAIGDGERAWALLLGLRVEGDGLWIVPNLPAEWPQLRIHYRHRETVYHILIFKHPARGDAAGGLQRVRLHRVERAERTITLVDDHREHRVEVDVWRKAEAAGHGGGV